MAGGVTRHNNHPIENHTVAEVKDCCLYVTRDRYAFANCAQQKIDAFIQSPRHSLEHSTQNEVCI
jgi:hypothetical protein